MRKSHLFAIVLVSVVLVTADTHAEQWQIIGPRALGMGGAHVAVVNDATAQYWNPGAFGFFDEPLPGARDKKNKLREKIKENDKAKKSLARKQKAAALNDTVDAEERDKKSRGHGRY